MKLSHITKRYLLEGIIDKEPFDTNCVKLGYNENNDQILQFIDMEYEDNIKYFITPNNPVSKVAKEITKQEFEEHESNIKALLNKDFLNIDYNEYLENGPIYKYSTYEIYDSTGDCIRYVEIEMDADYYSSSIFEDNVIIGEEIPMEKDMILDFWKSKLEQNNN